MNTVILFLLSINITASILFGIIIIFQIVSRQGKAAWHYGLMKLLLLYFLLTLVPFSVFVSANINSISLITLHLPDFKQAVSYHSSDFSGVLDIERFFLLLYGLYIWLAVALFLFLIRMAVGIFSFRKLLKNSVAVTDRLILCLVKECCKAIGIKREIPVFFSSVLSSPVVSGCITPRLFLADGSFSEDELRLIITHELYHFKSRDIFYRFLTNVLQCINWFNPVIYFFELIFYDYGEMACDEYVLRHSSFSEKKRYASLILDSARKSSKHMFLASFLCDSEKIMERRIFNIMKNHPNKHPRLVAGILGFGFMLCLPAVSYASVQGIAKLQTSFLDSPIVSVEELENEALPAPVETVQNYILPESVYSDSALTRGSNSVNVSVKAGSAHLFRNTYLSSGSSVSFSLSSSTGGSFSAAVIDENGTAKTVKSSDGVLASTVKISSDGYYEIVIENTSSENMTVSGNIKL